MERVDMHEEEEGCVVTHGSLFDLTHDTITEEDRLRYVKAYGKTEDIRMAIEAYKFKVKSKHKSKYKSKKSVPLSDAEIAKVVQEEQDYRNTILLQREENYDATVRLHEEMERAIEAQAKAKAQTQAESQAADEIRREKIRATIRNTHKARVLKSRRTRSIR
jgi:hypothetical protein